ncbi:MAG: MotA/TolQ/ExbB proton channel family protein [Phycisphaerae bacterium]|nr:MotA/TolQ/ExbB proton channel family protein [Phycisphaerae bacterium]NUQ45050.1 MotA/TolQ/ExbB proton channel family protein [Phycisphaerae bacterium]
MTVILHLLSLFTFAQTDAAPPAADIRVQSVWDFIIKGGPLMIPIGVASLIALTVIIERLISLRRRNVIPPEFLPGLTAALKSGDDIGAALDYCRKIPSPVANIFAAAIKRWGEPVELLEKHIDEAGRREIVKLRKYLRVLVTVGSVSTLLGLLGTIFGMITAFQTVAASADALGKTELLARGIYEAMITTAAGLIVAIPVIISHQAISARIDRLVIEIDQMTVDFLESYADRQRTDDRPALRFNEASRSTQREPAVAAAAGSAP